MELAILGAGNGGMAAAADMTLAGHEVNLFEFPQFKENIEPIKQTGGIKLVGVDYLSVDAFDAREPVVHRTLLEHGVIILEGLNLSHVPEGRYQLICLPLRVRDGDGAPARVVLAR